VDRLKQGVEVWNAWRSRARNGIPINLRGANLIKANLRDADLNWADLRDTHLQRADLRGANLSDANLRGVNLSEADLQDAWFHETVLADVDLSSCINLESIRHAGPSTIDIRTLQRSGPLPLIFLRGVGLSDPVIDWLPSLLNQPILRHSCFISYSLKDDAFVQRLYADLQSKGVRCWFVPQDMKIGAKILNTLDEAIRTRQKLLLVLSEASIANGWAEDEVTRAFAEERQRGDVVLYPVCVDEAVFETKAAWAAKLRDDRRIGDFRAWRDYDAWQAAVNRALRDLVDPSPAK
jgi:hypothetical protein